MDPKQNPFSIYDFLGYFIPGACLLYIIIYMNLDNSLLDLLLKENYNLSNLNYLPFIITSYISGHFLSYMSSITIEKYSIWSSGYPSKYLLRIPGPKSYFLKNRFYSNCKRLFTALIIFPITAHDLVFGKLLNLDFLKSRCLDQTIVDLILENAKKAYEKIDCNRKGGEINANDEDFFTMLYHYVLERNKNHSMKIQNYVALYGFLRCITLIFVISFWLSVFNFFNLYEDTTKYILLLSLTSFLSFIFYMAFKKFYRRYSLETLMALATMEH